MEPPKYLIIITIIDGQNFPIPDGVLDKSTDATVYAEARFGNEPLKSDPVKLINSNPEFVTELAWQLDKKTLHQLRIERRSVKLQIFMQTRPRKRSQLQQDESCNHGKSNGTSFEEETNKIELVGYTILDIRAAQEKQPPKFEWRPLLNPKFRKSSYNRPELHLALTLNKIDYEDEDDISQQSTQNGQNSNPESILSRQMVGGPTNNDDKLESDTDVDLSLNSKLYETCLDFTINQAEKKDEQLIENDICIRSKDGVFFIYDSQSSTKSTIESCTDYYNLIVTIPFSADLDSIIEKTLGNFHYAVNLFSATLKTETFKDLNNQRLKDVKFNIASTGYDILSTYFELNSWLDIKLLDGNETLGSATIQLDQLCTPFSPFSKNRSIEGIFVLQSINEIDVPSTIQPTIGVSVELSKTEAFDRIATPIEVKKSDPVVDEPINNFDPQFEYEMDELLSRTFDDTNILTNEEESTRIGIMRNKTYTDIAATNAISDAISQTNVHHFRFTIDLKNFSYTLDQKFKYNIKEIIVKYSYPYFGYQETIKTDPCVTINSNESILPHGFCEFNFATTAESLYKALKHVPLDLEIMTFTFSQPTANHNGKEKEQLIARCQICLADALILDEFKIENLSDTGQSNTISAPVYTLTHEELGTLKVHLLLNDLGHPKSLEKPRGFLEDIKKIENESIQRPFEDNTIIDNNSSKKLDEMKATIENWKTENLKIFEESLKKKESQFFDKLFKQFELLNARREEENRRKIEKLNKFERQLTTALTNVEKFEKRLDLREQQLNSKLTLLDTRLDTLDLEISKAVNDIRLEYEKKIDALHSNRALSAMLSQNSSSTGNLNYNKINTATLIGQKQVTSRRPSLRDSAIPKIQVPTRSTSLVRPSDVKLVKRPATVVSTVINGIGLRRPLKLCLSKETQEKVYNLRREKAELLKRGCRPSDSLIQDINDLIEKLAC